MIRVFVVVALFAIAALPSFAEDWDPIRDPVVNTETPEGGLIASAGSAEDPGEKIQFLEAFVSDFSENRAIGYVYLQLMGLYGEQGQFDKVVDYGGRILEKFPDDLEVRHLVLKAYEGQKAWDKIIPHVAESKPLAVAGINEPMPEDAKEYVEDEEAWKARIEYATGVNHYLEYSLYAAFTQQTTPDGKIAYLDALREHYPEGQYSQIFAPQYASAYQQAGDMDKAAEWMEIGVESEPLNETYLWALSAHYFGKPDNEKAKMWAEKLVAAMDEKPKPENQTDEGWEAYKAKYKAYGNYLLGRQLVSAGKFREGRKTLLTTVDAIKAEGGQMWGTLGYFLGFCYVKLDIGGDNVRQAKYWMGVGASTDNPFKAQAATALSKIR